MRRILRPLLIALGILMLPVSALALTTQGSDTLLVGQGVTHNDIYAGGGGTVNAGATFNDDLFIGGGTVTITGPVKGDVFVGGGTVKISGEVSGSIRAGGGTVELAGKVGRNVLVFGGSVMLETASDVGGEVLVFGGDATLNGHVAKAVNVWAGKILVNGKLDGNANLRTGDDCGDETCVTLGPNAIIGGNLTYWAATEAEVQAGSQVKGTTTHNQPTGPSREAFDKFWAGFQFWSLLSSLLIGLLLALVIPRTLRRISDLMVSRFWPSIGLGLLFFFLTPIAIVILMVTVIGIPLGLMLAAAYIIDIFLTKIFLGYLTGIWAWRWIKKTPASDSEQKKSRVVWTMLFGIVLFSVVFDFLLASLLEGPAILGAFFGLVRFGLLVWALGALVVTKWQTVQERG